MMPRLYFGRWVGRFEDGRECRGWWVSIEWLDLIIEFNGGSER